MGWLQFRSWIPLCVPEVAVFLALWVTSVTVPPPPLPLFFPPIHLPTYTKRVTKLKLHLVTVFLRELEYHLDGTVSQSSGRLAKIIDTLNLTASVVALEAKTGVPALLRKGEETGRV